MLHLILRSWWLIVLCLLATPNAPAADAPATTAEWRIETRQQPAYGIPTSKLDLVINGRQVIPLVSGEVLGDYHPLARKDFADRKIPAKAICACESHVVNSGLCYYVVAAGKDRLVVYSQYEDVDGPQGFKKMRTIKVEAR